MREQKNLAQLQYAEAQKELDILRVLFDARRSCILDLIKAVEEFAVVSPGINGEILAGFNTAIRNAKDVAKQPYNYLMGAINDSWKEKYVPSLKND